MQHARTVNRVVAELPLFSPHATQLFASRLHATMGSRRLKPLDRAGDSPLDLHARKRASRRCSAWHVFLWHSPSGVWERQRELTWGIGYHCRAAVVGNELHVLHTQKARAALCTTPAS